MTIEPTTTDTSGLDVLPPARPMQSGAVEQLMAHAQAMHTAKQFADALCDTDMVPAIYRGKPGNGAAAILYGAELGLSPIQALQNIFVVHGQPAIYARTAVALLKRHGVKFYTIEESPQAVTIRAERDGEAEESTWTIERATTADFTSNKKYQTEPQAMLWAKAAMEVSRRIAPDILLGIAYSAEEMEAAAPQPVRASRPAPAPRRGVDGLRHALAAKQQPEPEPAPPPDSGMAESTRRKWVNRMFALLGDADCTDRDDQLEVIATFAGVGGLEHRDALTDDQLRKVVNLLNEETKQSTLGQRITDILNEAALRHADAEAADQ